MPIPFGLLLSILGGGLSSLLKTVLSCTPCMIALALAGAFLFGDIHATRRERAACHAADIAIQLKAKERDVAIEKDKREFAEGQLKDLEAAKAASDAKVGEYEKLVEAGKIGRCALSPDAVKRLRDILR